MGIPWGVRQRQGHWGVVTLSGGREDNHQDHRKEHFDKRNNKTKCLKARTSLYAQKEYATKMNPVSVVGNGRC